MKNSKIFKICVFGLFCIILSFAVTAFVNYEDAWTESYSGEFDGVVWGSFTLVTFASNIDDAECICYDWCDDGSNDDYASWDHCFCLNEYNKLACRNYSSVVSNVCTQGNCVAPQLYLESDHNITTGNSGDRWTCKVDIREFIDCNDNYGQQDTIDHDMVPYFVIYPKKYNCSGQYFDTLGRYGSSNEWYIYDEERACSSAYTQCDTNADHTHHDNQEVTSPKGTIPDPCSTKDGSTAYYACNANADCYSGNCGGARNTYLGHCDSDGSNGFTVNRKIYEKSCGGAGYNSNTNNNWTYTTCSTAMSSSSYVCDSGLADYGGEYSSYLASNYCRLKEYANCTSNSSCWNDDGGYDCRGGTNKICTTGSNGKNCYNEDDAQCISGRCDTTCQAKLNNSESCNENSDCISNKCCGGTCSDSCSSHVCGNGICESGETNASCSQDCKSDGSSCSYAAQCYSRICVCGVCRATNTFYGDTCCSVGLGETCSNSNDCGSCNPFISLPNEIVFEVD
jgi:hypothetical protein